MEGEDDLDILTSLLEENEEQAGERNICKAQAGVDGLDGLFDNDDDEEFDEGLEEEGSGAVQHGASALFGDVDDLEEEEEEEEGEKEERSSGKASDNLNKSKEDLEAELRRMKEQMQRLQQRLEATQGAPATTPRNSPPTKSPPTQKPTAQPDKPAAISESESSPTSQPFRNNNRTSHHPKPSAKAASENSPVGHRMSNSLPQPVKTNDKLSSRLQPLPSTAPARRAPPQAQQASPRPPAAQHVDVERFSGLRIRKPRVSSSEMERKMADRRLIRLSQLPERLAREKLEDSDWVTFAVVVNKVTPQSNSSGKTFSIWKLNDLHNLEVYVSLFLFGEVHKEHWKTHPGTVIGILNPSLMKPKEGSDGVCLSVDHAQKVLLMGEAQDFGTCKATKKNGDPCSQLVNLYDCPFCQYHVKAQYKKMSSKRAELQSSFSGKVAGKARGGGGASLKERLCQNGFHYGGVSSAACAASLTASQPKKPSQTTLRSLFVRGTDQIVNEAKRIAMQADKVSGCSDDFRSLLSMPTPGALNMKRHLSQPKPSGSAGSAVGGIQSISASQLLKQQKRQLLESRRKRAEEIEKRFLQNSEKAGAGCAEGAGLGFLKGGREDALRRAPAPPRIPTLGHGLTQGEDVLFFDHTPPPPPPSPSLSAAKLAALKKLREKGGAIAKQDPNAVKRKRLDGAAIAGKVENSLLSPQGEQAEPEEPALKKRREQLDYLQSDEFQEILNAKSRHTGTLQAAEIQIQEKYFDPLVKKEQMEEKMRNIREMKCRAVTCKTCKYTYFKPLEQCVEKKHDYHWHDAVKRFFKCPCGQRAIALDRLPHKHCSNCGLFKWERDAMLKEKSGPKIAGELLLTRGEEQPKFLNSMN